MENLAPWREFGNLLISLRKKAGIAKQAELAKLLNAAQQTVSRWERGLTRPRDRDMPAIAAVLAADVNELLEAAGYTERAPAAAAFDKPFPVHALTPESFERFCAAMLQELYRDEQATVHRAGAQGHTQDGIDIKVRLPNAVHTFQCKRVNEFGPGKVSAVIKKHILQSDKKVLLLSLTASPQARHVIETYPDWEIWDQDDISRRVRTLPKRAQINLVDTFFRGQRFELLGEPEVGPWQTVEQYFAPFCESDRLFNHTWALVGRAQEISDLRAALSEPTVLATMLLGVAGGGKTRLLRHTLDWFESAHSTISVWIASSTEEITSKSLEGLGQGKKLLVIDDAHDRDDLATLLRYVADAANGARVMLCFRPYGAQTIRNQATTLSLSGPYVREIALGRPTIQEAESLARQVLERETAGTWATRDIEKVAGDIAKVTYDSPLATVIGAQIVAKERLHPDLLGNNENFQCHILSRFSGFITGSIATGQDADRLKAVLRIVALVQPIVPDQNSLLELLERTENIGLADATRLLKLLVNAGVLFRRGVRYRLSPDLLADTIIEESCIGIEGRSTGYAERVFDRATPEHLKNILVNLGKLDWRQRKGDTSESQLLSGFWGRLKWQDNYFNPHIDAAAGAAYYQPRQALEFARRLIREGHGSNGTVCSMIKHAAYNSAFVQEACALLWQVGHSDTRPLNRHPDHGIRILNELVEPAPNKPIEYIDRIVEFALSLIADPDRSSGSYTPFDVLEAALATEGHTTAAANSRTITLSAFSVSRFAMKPTRQRVLAALFEAMTAYTDKRAFLAAQTLRAALHGPHGMMGMQIPAAETKEWQNEFEQTLAHILQVLVRNDVPPTVVVRAAGSVSWHAYYGDGKCKELALQIIGLLERDLDTRVCRALMDGWGHSTWPLDDKTDATSHDSDVTALIEKLQQEFPQPYDLFEYLEKQLVDIAMMTGSHGDSFLFINRIIAADPELAEAILEVRLRTPQSALAEFAGMGLATLLNRRPNEARRQISSLLRRPNIEMLRLVAEAYARASPPEVYASVDVEALRAVFASKDSIVLRCAAGVSRQVAQRDLALAIDLISRVDMAVAPAAGDDFFSLLSRDETIPFSLIHNDQLQGLLEQLRQLKELDDYWVKAFLKKCMKRVPALVVNLAKNRLEDAVKQDDWALRPLDAGYRQEHSLNLLEHDDGKRHLVSILDWALPRISDPRFAFRFGELVAGLCGRYDDVFAEVIGNWVAGGSLARAQVVAAILREAHTEFLYEQEAFVHKTLQTSRLIGIKALEAVSGAIFGSAVSGGGWTAPGEPFPHDLRLQAHAKKVLGTVSRLDPAFELFTELLHHAEQRIERQRREKEVMDAEDEEL